MFRRKFHKHLGGAAVAAAALFAVGTPATASAVYPGVPEWYAQAKVHFDNTRNYMQAVIDAINANDLAAAGRLMNDSHASLRDLYEVSCPALDLVCELSRAHPACYGARMTGAGFGGCAVALVAADRGEAFVSEVEAAYRGEGAKSGGEAGAEAAAQVGPVLLGEVVDVAGAGTVQKGRLDPLGGLPGRRGQLGDVATHPAPPHALVGRPR